MLRNYLIVTIRSLLRDRFYTTINVAGLAVGLAACLLLAVFIQHETSYDRHHEKGDRIYKVLREMRGGDGKARINADTSGPLGPAIEADYPEVELAVRTLTRPMLLSSGDRNFTTSSCLTDTSFLSVFTRELEAGDPTSLHRPQTAFITREVSRALFDEASPIGKTVTLKYKWFEQDYTITGILAKDDHLSVPELSFSFLTADPPKNQGAMNGIYKIWRKENFFRPLRTYVLLREGTSADALEAKLNDFVARHMGDDIAEHDDYHLQPLEEMYLRARYDYGYVDTGYGDIKDVYVLSAIGSFILLIACVNFVNLETARSSVREREVGMRKVVGAERSDLLSQFLGEAVLVTTLAALVGWGLAELCLPAFNGFVNRDLSLDLFGNPTLLAVFCALTLCVGLASGSYPALILSRFNPIRMLRGGHTVSAGGGFLRRGLVVFQFAVSMFLIIATTVVYSQGTYIKSKDRGFDYEAWVSLPIFTQNRALNDSHNAVKASFLRHPAILKAAAGGGNPPGTGSRVARAVIYSAGDRINGVEMGIQLVDEDYIGAFGLKVVQGRGYNSAVGQETDAVLLSEEAVRRLGWAGKFDPVGKLIDFPNYDRTQPVIGVVKDFHNASLREPIGPVIFYMLPEGMPHRVRNIYLKLDPRNIDAALTFIREQWALFVPDHPFEMFFLDEVVEQDLAMAGRMMKVFGAGALLGIGIACLGLLGLVSFLTQQRTKEICVRKVMGASRSNILALVYRDPILLAAIACLFAFPAAYIVMHGWLADYAYRIELGVVPFLAGLLLTGLMALVSVAVEGIRAVGRNPVEALRGE